MQKTNIEYLDYTWNPTHGCSPISEGCQNCWANVMAKRLAGMGVRGYSKNDPFKVVCSPDKLNEPLKIKKPSRIGVSFMGDLFHEDVPKEYLYPILKIIRKCYQHKFLILTKRIEWACEIINNLDTATTLHFLLHKFNGTGVPEGSVYSFQSAFPNLWLGVSVENQKTADERIPILLDIPAAIRFVSVEPMLGEIDLTNVLGNQDAEQDTSAFAIWHGKIPGIDWVICGAESGQNRRPMKYEWAMELMLDCADTNTPFFYKQGLDDDGNWCKMPKLQGIVWNQTLLV